MLNLCHFLAISLNLTELTFPGNRTLLPRTSSGDSVQAEGSRLFEGSWTLISIEIHGISTAFFMDISN